MGKTIALVNQKGGVGKTTTAVNLAAALGAMGRRVLLADVDPQGNSTSGLGINKRGLTASAYDALVNGTPAKDVILSTPYKNVFVMPSNMELAGAVKKVVTKDGRSFLGHAVILAPGAEPRSLKIKGEGKLLGLAGEGLFLRQEQVFD